MPKAMLAPIFSGKSQDTISWKLEIKGVFLIASQYCGLFIQDLQRKCDSKVKNNSIHIKKSEFGKYPELKQNKFWLSPRKK